LTPSGLLSSGSSLHEETLIDHRDGRIVILWKKRTTGAAGGASRSPRGLQAHRHGTRAIDKTKHDRARSKGGG